MRGRVRQGV